MKTSWYVYHAIATGITLITYARQRDTSDDILYIGMVPILQLSCRKIKFAPFSPIYLGGQIGIEVNPGYTKPLDTRS